MRVSIFLKRLVVISKGEWNLMELEILGILIVCIRQQLSSHVNGQWLAL